MILAISSIERNCGSVRVGWNDDGEVWTRGQSADGRHATHPATCLVPTRLIQLFKLTQQFSFLGPQSDGGSKLQDIAFVHLCQQFA
jgi:hypothetical protein